MWTAGTCPPSAFSPDELFAVEAEGGLTQVRGHELMAVDLVDLASDSTLPLSRKLFVGFLFHRGLVWQGKKELIFESETQHHETVWALGKDGHLYIYNTNTDSWSTNMYTHVRLFNRRSVAKLANLSLGRVKALPCVRT